MRTPPSSSTARAYIHVHGLKAGDPEWALRIGDCLRNARTALDYLMGRLVCVAAGKGPMDIDDVHFPICTTPMRFQDGLPQGGV